jgi:hypothetical protein
MRPSLGGYAVGSVRCGLSHLWWRSEFADVYRRLKNLLKLLDVIKARHKIHLPATQSHYALTAL